MEKLYNKDSYIKSFTASVVSCERLEDYYETVLDKTAFFPEQGGQTGDDGFIGKTEVFDTQIKKAENRGDLVSVNHRVTEFLASYFDIIFALNEMTHPGEKRMQSICSSECKILPHNFDANLQKLFDGMFRESIFNVIEDMVAELKKIC